ncbi:AAA family ATPase [Mediterraneibacter faecis]|uniref:AAA family ATPase n=1 Tax=Mediterraneibacter faecis TaxID=592978 RepID=UPI003F964F47
MISETEIRKAISLLKTENQLFEVRVIYNSKQMYSGYFKTADDLIKAFNKDIRDYANCNIYITLNSLNEACYSREQQNFFKKNAKATSSDNDVVGYDWMFIDVDPKRPTGTSSSDDQVAAAKEIGNKVYSFMKNIGFYDPLFGFSGNGVHLLYRIKMKNSDENRELIKKCLNVLDMYFSDDEIQIDLKNFNPARVCKLYGTQAQKGANTEERPHRMSMVIGDQEEIRINDAKYVKKLADMLPKEEKPQRYNNYQPAEFDLDEWLSKYGLRYRKTSYSGGVKYILDECPFDSNHKGKDACVFRTASGAIGFHCFHNSCADKTWRDVRLLYEPDAYEKKQQEYERKIYAKPKSQPERKKIEEKEGRPVFLTAKDILTMPKSPERFVKTGINDIDKRMRGLKTGYTSVISGLRASGKSSVISEICLDCVEAGNKVAVYSGELSPQNFMRWMNLQAAGKAYAEPTQFEGYYNVSRQNQEKIAEWLSNNFSLYNNEYGNDFLAIKDQLERKFERNKPDLVILDNLMAFDIKSLSDNKYEAQTAFTWSLHEMAQKYDVHIMFVAHPRKAMGFLRLDDISGTADIGNAVDNAFIVHRVNNDFKRLSMQMFGWKADDDLYTASNVIEIAKDRDGGLQDYFIPLYYEVESKRLKNSFTENKIYGWGDNADGFTGTDQMQIPFE